jgi:Ca-activated chloride channel family protein
VKINKILLAGLINRSYFLTLKSIIMKNLFCYFVIAVIFITHTNAQTRTITGVVSDGDNGQPLAGVSVIQKGTTNGTLTDASGSYQIGIVAGDQVLIFAFAGMQTREMLIQQSNRMDVVLYPELIELEELIVENDSYQIGKRVKTAVGNMFAPAYESSAMISPVMQDHNTESYTHHAETGYKDVLLNPLSTFSIDVDNASYANMRRFIDMGQLPPPDAVRVEELLNYFNYDYPQPTGGHPYAIYTELSECPWNPNAQLLHVGLKGLEIDKSELPPSNLVFLIDVSGSMNSPNKLPLVKTSLKMLLEELRPLDRVAIVVYSGTTALLLPSTPASEKMKIIRAIDGLHAGGSTAGGQAMRMAYDVATANYIEEGNNRIIMTTDGDFNVGESSNAAMERLVEEKRRLGVYITVLGFGMGNYKDDRLEIIANKGNGNYGYIDNIQEARKLMVSEFAGTMFTIAKDVKLQIEFNPARVKAYRLIGYENRRLNDEDFNNDTKDAGEMGAGHSVTALYEIIPAGSDLNFPGVDELRYQPNTSPVDPDPRAELLTVKTRYKRPDGNQSILFDLQVQGRIVPLARTSDDFRFAAAVAEFGLLLRQSPYQGNATLKNALEMAQQARGKDEDGFRAAFVNLVKTTISLDELSMRE